MLTTDSAMSKAPIVDGFTHSMTVLMLPTTYRALVLAQMEVLRRSTNYQFKMYSAPDAENETIVAFSQNEYQVKMRPGTLIWGAWMATPNGGNLSPLIFFQVTDMSTGTALMSDYECAQLVSATINPAPARQFGRYPYLLAEPRTVSGNGQVVIEVYNSSASAATVQLVLFCAEPIPLPDPCADPAIACTQE